MARERTRVRVRSELKNTAYEIFIGVLSILSIVNLVLMYAFASDPSLQLVLSVMNGLFSGIFLGDFLYRIFTAPSAAHYFFRGFGWADLFASLPFPQVKVLRVFRVLRVYRLLRELGPRTLWTTLIHDRANSALMTLLLMGIFVLQFGSLSILGVEGKADGANITSASDALWYTVVTISTVGYGDQFPVTNAGRLIGTLIIVVGVGIFGTFTGYLANLFLGPSKAGESEEGATVPTPSPHGAGAPRGASGRVGPDAAPDTAGAAAVAPTAAADVAPGEAPGPVRSGATVSERPGAGEPTAVTASDDASADHTRERLRALLAQSEETMAEIRRLLADSRS